MAFYLLLNAAAARRVLWQMACGHSCGADGIKIYQIYVCAFVGAHTGTAQSRYIFQFSIYVVIPLRIELGHRERLSICAEMEKYHSLARDNIM